MIKNLFLVALIPVFATLCLQACTPQTAAPKHLHLDPEMSAAEMNSLLLVHPEIAEQPEVKNAQSDLKEITDSGVRLYAWQRVVNQSRPANQQLTFTSKETQSAYSIENPRPYNAETIKRDYLARIAASPAALLTVLQDPSKSLPANLPTTDDVFIAWGLQISSSYDLATRWIMFAGSLDQFKPDQANDVRGYYFLTRLADRDLKLAGFASLDAPLQTKIREWLTYLCLNNQDVNDIDVGRCKKEVASAESKSALVRFYNSKIAAATDVYENYFRLVTPWIRTDITWTMTDPTVAHYPFLLPSNPSMQSYLKDNVEDEFRTESWHLQIEFVTKAARSTSHLESVPGVTPHAEPSSSVIVIDENEPITEYGSRWMIRHEFGHLLGFTDCYVEFYDESAKAMMYYQIDTENLMCSRRGKFQPQHFEKLKAAYLK